MYESFKILPRVGGIHMIWNGDMINLLELSKLSNSYMKEVFLNIYAADPQFILLTPQCLDLTSFSFTASKSVKRNCAVKN